MDDILIGADWDHDIVVSVPSGMTSAELVTEMTGATATALIENSAGTTVATCTAVVDGTTKTISCTLTDTQTGALTAQTGLYMDVRYTTTGGLIRGVRVGASFRIIANPWA